LRSRPLTSDAGGAAGSEGDGVVAGGGGEEIGTCEGDGGAEDAQNGAGEDLPSHEGQGSWAVRPCMLNIIRQGHNLELPTCQRPPSEGDLCDGPQAARCRHCLKAHVSQAIAFQLDIHKRLRVAQQQGWCERSLLITESPKTPGHYRYLIVGPRLHPLYGIGGVQFAISRVPVYTAVSIFLRSYSRNGGTTYWIFLA